MNRYYIETYGCTLNKTDSALIEDILLGLGYSSASNIEDADIVLINTCTVRSDTEDRLLRRIRELCDKAKKLVVTGCLASAQPCFVIDECSKAVILDTISLVSLPYIIGGKTNEWITGRDAIYRKSLEVAIHRAGPILSVPLCDGCLDACNFCITKVARPYIISRKPDKLVSKLRESVKALPYEVVEIQLTGQDLAVYGLDIAGKQTLPSLLEDILSQDFGGKLIKIRLGMMTPNRFEKIADAIIKLIKSDKRIYRFLHLPVQSGDNGVLRLMNRGYRVEDFVRIINFVRKEIPDVQIATDVIVGHPGEDERAFLNTVELIRRYKIERVHIAQYSPRPHTISARMPQVPDREKKRRSKILNSVYIDIGLKWHSRLLNEKIEIYVVEKSIRKGEAHLIGRTDNYVSVVLKNGSDALLGRVARAYISDVTYYDARGYVVEN